MSYHNGATLQTAPTDGVDLFLKRFCNQPELLLPAFKRSRRMVSTKDGAVLCEKGDEANGIWIVVDGLYRVEDDGEQIGFRHPGC